MRSLRTLLAHLRKEARDGRGLLVGMAAVVTTAVVLGVALLPGDFSGHPMIPVVVALGCFVLGLLAVVSDLVPGEARRRKLEFLLRLPSGLRTAFAAKAIYALATLAAVTLSGYLVAAGAVLLLGGDPGLSVLAKGFAEKRWAFLDGAVPTIMTAIGVVGWVLAVSCWLPRSMLVLPATALTLGAFGLPLYLIYTSTPLFGPQPPAVLTLFVALCVAPYPIAFLSFVRGRRFGRGAWSGAWRGLVATALLFVPAYVYAAVDVRGWKHVDLSSEKCRIQNGYLGTGGRYVFLNVTMARRVPFADAQKWPHRTFHPFHAVIVDLETGAWRVAGEPLSQFYPVGVQGQSWWRHERADPLPVVALWDCRTSTWIDEEGREGRRGYWMRYHDGATGEVIKAGWSHLRHEEVERPGVRRPPEAPEGEQVWSRCGLGFWLRGQKIYDPFRDRMYSGKAFRDRGIGRFMYVRPGRWLVRWKGCRVVLFDPDTAETEPVRGFDLTQVQGLLEDGRVLTFDPDTRTQILLEPESGVRHDLGVAAESASPIARTPAGAYLVRFQFEGAADRGPRFRYARLDPGTLALTWFGGLDDGEWKAFTLLAILAEDTLLGIHDGRRIVRVTSGSDDLEVLFPR